MSRREIPRRPRWRTAGGGDAFEAREARDAVCALGVELVGEAGRGLLVMGHVAAVSVFDCYGGELGHGCCG